MSDWTGQQLADYRFLRLLGQGTFGAVYEGEHVFLKTHVAIKVLHAHMDQTEFEHFLAEARAIAALEHPHIVRILTFSMQEQTPYLVMQLAHSSLKERFPLGHPQPVEAILPFVQQAASGLQHAHDQQIMHLDIKPANLLVTTQQEVLLTDFGLALALQTHRTHQTVPGFAGTPAYAAPEQFQNKPGWASDQYALGIMAYQWLTGKLPFTGAWMAIGHQKSTQDPPSPRNIVPTISVAVEQVILRTLATDPQQRFASVLDFAVALAQAAAPSSSQSINQLNRAFSQIDAPPAQSAFGPSPLPLAPTPPAQPAASLTNTPRSETPFTSIQMAPVPMDTSPDEPVTKLPVTPPAATLFVSAQTAPVQIAPQASSTQSPLQQPRNRILRKKQQHKTAQRFVFLGLIGVVIVALSGGITWFIFRHVPPTRNIHVPPTGSITEFPLPTPQSNPNAIMIGPDGNLWFTEPGSDKIGRITLSGRLTEFPLVVASHPGGITSGPDGNLWFTEYGSDKIGRITPGGTLTEFPIPTAKSAPAEIISGPDGNLWFTEDAGNKIGHITPSGTITEFPLPTPRSSSLQGNLQEIIIGPDGNLWFTEYDGNKIGRITS